MGAREFKKPEGMPAGGEIRFVRPSELANEAFTGVVVEGEFVEAVPNPLDDTKNDFKFVTEEGETVIVNHSGSLAYRMKFVSPGDFCQVNYLGKSEIKSGRMKGKSAHNFEVLVA